MLPVVKIIVVGKLKNQSYLSLESNYLKRFKRCPEIIELKKSSENIKEENNLILNKLNNFDRSWRKVFLTEKGKLFNSTQLANNLIDYNSKNHVFVIGGSYGFTDETLSQADLQLALSPLTFPHQMARLIFIEQLYRSETIINNHPYHH